MKEFFPFEETYDGADEGIDIFLETLDFSKVQRALLWQLLRRFEINAWFDLDEDGGDPRLAIATFWDRNHVASIPLTVLLEHIVTFDNDIGLEEEIAALTKLKTLIQQAIASRQQQQSNDAEAVE